MWLDPPVDPVQGDSREQCGLNVAASRRRYLLKDPQGALASGLGGNE